MAEWRVNLDGDKFDLHQLETLLFSSDPRISQEEGRYFLTGDRLNKLGTSREVVQAAEEILQSLNGLARLRLKSHKPLSIGNFQRIDDDGKRRYHMPTLGGNLSMRGSLSMVVTRKDGTVEEIQNEDPLPSWFSLAGTDQTVARVLRMYGKVVQPWKDLYPIYEIMESDGGGEAALVSKGWASRNQIERFKRTANHSIAGGEDARHGASTTQPPPNPMTPAEGREFVESLLNQWLSFKQTQYQSP